MANKLTTAVNGESKGQTTFKDDIVRAHPPGHGTSSASAAADNAHDEIEQLRAQLREAESRLELFEESSRHLISNISHELRTPITHIQGYVEGMLEGVITDPFKQRRSLEIIHTKVLGMNRLITDLFKLTALETRQVYFELRPVLVQTLKEHLKCRFELDVEQSGHSFQISSSPLFDEQALYVNVDLERLDQVFTNLIANAFRHLPKTGGLIVVNFECVDDELLIRFKDNGDGISETDLPFIFDRFYRAKVSRSECSQSGIGLGLSICREIVASHGGAIYVDSEPGEGAEFVFTLPIAAAS